MSETTTEQVVLAGLSPQDIAALREADNVTFHVMKGCGFIRCHLDGYRGEPRIFTKREQVLFPDVDLRDRRREIGVDQSTHGYTDAGLSTWQADKQTTAFHMEHGSKYDRPWQTVVSLLRTGDVLRLDFVGSNNNGYLKEAGLHLDSLTLSVTRGKRRMEFLLATSVCPDNSARMVKRYGS